ncbi:MAG: nucleotide exchange factor GrpE [Candidatus Micrarchaeia archaeon]
MAHDNEGDSTGEVKEEKKATASENAPKDESKASAEENGELKERLLRLAAEFDNYKKRTANEVSTAKRMGIAELMKPLLNVLDEFELTIIALGKAKDDNISKGIEMLYSNFVEVLRSFGLKEVDADSVFDPYKHEIVLAREDSSRPGTILEVVKKGYMLDGKLLRPASVIVAKEKDGNVDRENMDESGNADREERKKEK